MEWGSETAPPLRGRFSGEKKRPTEKGNLYPKTVGLILLGIDRNELALAFSAEEREQPQAAQESNTRFRDDGTGKGIEVGVAC